MNLIKSVFNISEQFMEDPRWVQLDYNKIKRLSQKMTSIDRITFPLPDIKNIYKAVLLELVGSSINYCYWYAKSSIRPGNACSTLMFNLVQEAFLDYTERDERSFNICISRLNRILSLNRFPLIEERIKHLNQLRKHGEIFACIIANKPSHMNSYFNELIQLFPGFASDTFLKRASLFFIQLFRRFGWFEKDLHSLHVPADYQIPKMLRHFGCIEYDSNLKNMINENELIPKHSVIECEIRAATIIAMKELCTLTGWNIAEVDAWLFLQRNDAKENFHLTVTTDY